VRLPTMSVASKLSVSGSSQTPTIHLTDRDGIIGHRFDEICSLPNITRSWTTWFCSKG
jgi:hypothetical protein